MTPRARPTGQDGFTMVLTLGILFIMAAMAAAAFAAVIGDIPLRKESREKKSAYAAAESGLNYYLSRLNQDNEYWTRCDTSPSPAPGELNPVNQRWDGGSGGDPRRFRVVPGDTSTYTVELLPATGAQCMATNQGAAMLNPATGEMRIRATGRAGTERRSIIATLRRKSFLDYLYFTDYEVVDPALTGDTDANCRRYRVARAGSGCTEIQFASDDAISGPFHSNDSVLTCNSTTFGRSAADRIETASAAPGWRNACGSSAPDFRSTWQAGAERLQIPTNNDKVASVAVAPYILTGTHRIQLNDTSMTVTPPTGVADNYDLPLPPNGVISVRDGASCTAALPNRQNYTEASGCANVYVKGRYARSLTIVSSKDVIVDGDITRASDDSLLGLIATNYVRVFHPVVRWVDDGVQRCANPNPNPAAGNRRIDAAILALNRSFVVDNHDCGTRLGTLTVNGAIAQVFRGPVGTSGGSGYLKAYNYDDRMRYRNPPYFLDPVSASWRLLKVNEQVPAR